MRRRRPRCQDPDRYGGPKLASTEAEWSQIYPLGTLLLAREGVAIGGGLVSLGRAMSESTPEESAFTLPNFFGGDK
jgi:hypothetical protein